MLKSVLRHTSRGYEEKKKKKKRGGKKEKKAEVKLRQVVLRVHEESKEEKRRIKNEFVDRFFFLRLHHYFRVKVRSLRERPGKWQFVFCVT